MPLELQPLTKEDVLEAGQLVIASFANNPFRKLLFPNGMGQANIDKIMEAPRKAVDDPDQHAIKVVDTDNGRIVGCALWAFTKPMSDEDWAREREEAVASYPEARPEILAEFIHKAQDIKRRIKGSRRWWELKALNTLPEYQRRGIGSMLMDWGIEKLEEMKLPGFIESTKAGYRLYTKHGFKEIERWEFDMGRWPQWGGEGMYKNAYLTREPSEAAAP